MRVLGVVCLVARFVWRYLAAVALVAGLAAAMIGVAVGGTGPAPQQPLEGYSVSGGRVSLEWNKGTRKEPVTLEVSVGDPSFSKPILKRVVTGTSHPLNDLRPGNTYYWRLLQDGEAGPTASFEVPANYVQL